MATMQDIADKLGVSKGTVSKALSGATDVSETLQKKVLDTAVAVGYTKLRRPNTNAQKLCILISDIEYEEPHQFGYDIVLGFRQMAEPKGYTVEIVPATDTLQRTLSYDAFMLQNNYLGAFVLGFNLSSPWMKDFRKSHTPAILYDNYIPANPTIASIGVDNREAMELAVSHLKQLGHKSIGYLSSALGSYVMQQRHKAFFHALRQNGLNADYTRSRNAYMITECVEKHLPKLLDMGVTAVMCSHDQLANAAMIQCQQLGVHVPDDISIIGFDDLPFSAYAAPPLTTIRQDRIQLGKSGFYALDSLVNGLPLGTILLHAGLIVRKSSGAVRIL